MLKGSEPSINPALAAGPIAHWLPRHLVERRTPLPPPGEEEVFAGTLLRLDIRDFSSRPDRVAADAKLRRRERAAAEDLAQVVEDTFRPIFYAVDRHGGSVASLEGDAVLALFRGPGHPLRARRAMDDVLAVRPTLHAAVATGEVRALQLAGGEQRHEMLYGPALGALERVEDESAVIAISGEEGLDGHVLIDPPESELLRFVPPPLRGTTAPPPVHRRVVVCFIAVPIPSAVGAYRVIAEEAESQGALVLKVRAEGNDLVCLVLSGAPMAHEDDPLRAVQFALSARDRMVDAVGTKPRISLVDGSVLALVLGDGTRLCWDVIGDPVNVAYRLLSEAKAGEIVATSALLESVRTAIASPVQAVSVRGKTRPIGVRRVTGLTAARRDTPDNTYPRKRELSQLDALLDGQKPAAIVAAAGMGKRYLWQEWSARNPDWRVLRATCHDYGAVRPLAPFVGAVRRLGGEAATRQALFAALGALPGMDDRATGVLEAFVGSGAPQLSAVMAALRQLFVGLATESPTVLIVEDIQWADADAIAFVTRLAVDAARTPLRLVVTARPRTTLPVGFTLVELLPLSMVAARTVITQLAAGTELDPAVIDRIVQRAAGSPRELAVLTDAARRGNDELPDSMEAWYASRIDALDSSAREVLERAAVLGRTLDHGLLRRLAADVPRAEEALRALMDARLLVADDLGARIAFDREATREIAYMRMTSARRRQLHTRVGRVYQARASAGSTVAPEVLAWHLSRSDAPKEALGPLVEASRRALAHGRPRLALSHAEHAARIAREHAPDSLPAVQRSLGDAMLALGRADLALEAFRSVGDPALTVEVGAALVAAGYGREALQAVVDLPGAMAAAVRARALSLVGDPLAREAHAAALASAGTPAERARALRFYGADLARDDRFFEALQVLDEALKLSQQAGDPGGKADALDLYGSVLGLVGEYDRALLTHRQALVIREVQGRPEGIAGTLRRIGRAESRRGEGSRALGHLVAARSLLRDAGLESRLSRIEVELAEVRWRRNEPEHARRHLDAATELTGRTRARHALLEAMLSDGMEGERRARKAITICEQDRWRSGALLAQGLVAKLVGDPTVLNAVLADLREIRHVEFANLVGKWVEDVPA